MKKAASRLFALALIALLVVAIRALPVADWLEAAATWVDSQPVLGPLAYVGLTVLAAILLTPGWIPMALAGVLFGFVPGLVLGSLGVTLGALAAMLAGRTVARPWVARRIAGNPTLAALDEALEEQAFLIVFLTRAAMVLPFNILNYAYGVTRVRVSIYTAATAFGMLPIVGLYVYLGSLAEDIGAVMAGEARPAGGWWIVAVGIGVLVALIAVIRRTVTQILERKLGPNVESGSDTGDSDKS